MPSKHSGLRRKKPWAARVKMDGTDHYLGHYETCDMALEVENEWRRDHDIPELTMTAHEHSSWRAHKAWEKRRLLGT